MVKPFTIKCNKCGCEDIFFSSDYDHNVTLICLNEECDNSSEEHELYKDDAE